MYCDRSRIYGVRRWRDLFSPRQLLCHGTSVEVFREMLEADRGAGDLTDVRRAAYAYLALSLDKLLNYNSRMSVWMPTREVVANTFNRHDFAFCWSHAEMVPLIAGLGFDWAIGQTAKCIRELVSLVRPPSAAPSGLFAESAEAPLPTPPPLTITCKPAHDLDHIADASVDVVVMDPPYYDNVMYAELSDFFYVWLKRTAGHVFPELFRRRLTDKENEAVANPARFGGEKGAKARASRDYQERMAAIFAECRRVLKSDGIMTLMFTHKATGAWDALTTGLIEAGFVITTSWPINTEAQGSLHIKDKAAANSTIFLVCRPRTSETAADPAASAMAAEPVATYDGSPVGVEPSTDLFWEDIEPTVAGAVRRRVSEFQEAGITGVDLYLASFGPALEEFSRRWPVRRGRPRVEPARLRGTRKQHLFDKARDPYAAVPEDALDVARREVKRWRLQQLTEMEAGEDLDPTTAFFVLAWDAFKAPRFAYDEALRLARAAGVDLDGQIVGHLAEKRGQRPPPLGQRPPGRRRRARLAGRLARDGGRAPPRGEQGAPAHPRRGDGTPPGRAAGHGAAFPAGAQGGARSAPAPQGRHGDGPHQRRRRVRERLRGAGPAPPIRIQRPGEGATATLAVGDGGLLTALRSRHWRRKYTRDGGDLVAGFYVPALESAVRYDRLTGYFGAGALALAARGVEGLVRNDGRMRLVVGCTLDPPEVAAIEKGSAWREQVERRLVSVPLEPPDRAAADALELLAWMLARGFLDVKVAVPCDEKGRPTVQEGIFHEKSGIVEDRDGDRIAWTGSLNETRAGWTRNWESIQAFTSWGPEPERVADEEANFAAI